MMIRSVLIVFLLFPYLYSQESPEILQIRKDFKTWQPILKDSTNITSVKYLVFSGKNYENQIWIDNLKDSSDFVASQAYLYENDRLGKVVVLYKTSPSGDWFIYSENYYNNKDSLYFVFWTMNTFTADIPLTIERRLYFDANWDIMRKLESKYKMNTKEEAKEVSYYDMEEKYWLDYKSIPFKFNNK
jgi:hypothetical protein